MLWNNIICELYELARNMNWLDGLALIWYWHGCGFKSWRTQIKLYFCQISYQLKDINHNLIGFSF